MDWVTPTGASGEGSSSWVIVPRWGRGRAGTRALGWGCEDEGLLGWVSLCEQPLRNRTKPMLGAVTCQKPLETLGRSLVWLMGGVWSFRRSLAALNCGKRGVQWKGKAVVEEEGCLSDFCKCLCSAAWAQGAVPGRNYSVADR